MIKILQQAVANLTIIRDRTILKTENEVEMRLCNLIEYCLNRDEDKVGSIEDPIDPSPQQWPKLGDKVFLLTSHGKIQEDWWQNNDPIQNGYLSQGNIFRTYAQAEAERDLRAHIAEFKMPKRGDVYLLASSYDERIVFEKEINDFGYPLDFASYKAGLILPITATEGDIENRIKVLTDYGEAFS